MVVLGAVLACLAVVAGALAWRRHRAITNPASWPKNITLNREVSLVKAILRRQGWKILEPDLHLNVFVHAERDGVAAFLVIQNEHTLGLSILMTESLGKVAKTQKALGIVTLSKLPEHLVEDAERCGMYLINPADLKDLSPMIVKAKMRRQAVRAAGAREKGSVAGSVSKSLLTQ